MVGPGGADICANTYVWGNFLIKLKNKNHF